MIVQRDSVASSARFTADRLFHLATRGRRAGRLASRKQQTAILTMELLEPRINFGAGWNYDDTTTLNWPTTGNCPPTANASTAGSGGPASGGADGGNHAAAGSAPPSANSTAPVRYLDGTPIVSSTDLESDGFGQTFGIIRSWTGLNQAGMIGNGWEITDQPHMYLARNQNSSHDGVITVMDSDNQQEDFLVSNGYDGNTAGTIEPLYGTLDRLVYVAPTDVGGVETPGEFDLYNTAGAKLSFFDLPRDPTTGYLNGPDGYTGQITDQNSSFNYPFGGFKGMVDAGGVITATDYNTDGTLADMTRSGPSGGQQEGYFYSYSTISNAEGGSETMISEIQLERRASSSDDWSNVQWADYAYYTGDGSDAAYGRLGDLKQVTIKEPGGSDGVIVDQKYYRYYKLLTDSYYTGPTYNLPSYTGGSDTTYADATMYSGEAANVVMSGLRSVVEDAAFDRLSAATSGDYDTASPATVQTYADHTFWYEGYDDNSIAYQLAGNAGFDFTRYRVIQEVAQGAGCSACSQGQGVFRYVYTDSGAGSSESENEEVGQYDGWGVDGLNMNVWDEKVTVYLPSDASAADASSGEVVPVSDLSDDDTDTVYVNAYGEVMLDDLTQQSTGQQTLNYYQYDNAGRLILHASPAAISSFDESSPNLIDNDGFLSLLNTTSGLIDIYTYYASTDTDLTDGSASTNVSGGVAGYLDEHLIQDGTGGPAYVQEKWTYFLRTQGDDTYVPLATDTVYRDQTTDPADASAQTTSYTYTWLSGTVRPASMTTTLPVVTSAQNGPGTADNSTVYYDDFGWSTWTVDGDGYIDYTEHDPGTGVVVRSITDANPADVTDPVVAGPTRDSDLPTALALTTTYDVNGLGQTTEETSPNGNVTYTVYDDADHEVRVYPGWHYDSALGAYTTTGPIQITQEVRDGTADTNNVGAVYDQTITSSATPAVSDGVPTGEETIDASNIETMTRDLTNVSGQDVESDDYFSLSGITYSETSPRLGSASNTDASGNYYVTLTSFDARGREDRTVDPTGTITRTVYDVRGLPISTWVGTDDTPTSGYWSPTNTAGANLVETEADTYDADGNEISSTQYPGGDAAARVTLNYYDWRDRLVATQQGAGETDPTDHSEPITFYTYDNLNELLSKDQYDGDGITLSNSFAVSAQTPPAVGDPSFETPDTTSSGGDIPDPSGTAWNFGGDDSGIAQASSFDETAPDGTQIGYIGIPDGSVSQTITGFSAGFYKLSFELATATYFAPALGSYQSPVAGVTIDGYPLAECSPSNDGTFTSFTTPAQYLAAGSHTFKIFFALGDFPDDGETSFYIDSVSLETVAGTATTSDGSPTLPDSSLLRAETTYAYDNQGRVYRTSVFSVNPINGDVSSDSIDTNTWYDHRGNVIKTQTTGQAATKTTYDGADRPTIIYTTDSDDDAAAGTTGNWADASTVAGDTVLEQDETTYDADGNVIETADRNRFNTDTGTGALGTPTSGNEARVYYTQSFYDAADREIADVNVGTNGGSSFTPYTSVPSRSDTVLVTSTTYNPAGWANETTDPRGIVTKTDYDNAGQSVATIADYTDGTPTNSSNQTTDYTYDGDGHITSMIAVMPSGETSEETQYIYGATTASGSNIDSNDLLVATDYPDLSTGEASTGQQETYSYDALGEKIGFTDRNGSVHAYSYDVLGRETMDRLTTMGSGAAGLNGQALAFTYNSQGLPFTQTVYAVVSSLEILNQDEDVYNGLGQLSAEYQSIGVADAPAVNTSTTPEVQYAYSSLSTGSRRISMTYPNGRQIDYNYSSGVDSDISRVSSISDDSTGTILESEKYLGVSTIVERDHPEDGVNETDISSDGSTGGAGDMYTGLDRFGRLVDEKWVNASGTVVDEYQYGYDPDGNVIYKLNVVSSSNSELYTYDNLNRLINFERGTLASGDASISGTPSETESWTLDALGNQLAVTLDGSTTDNTFNAQNEMTSYGSTPLYYDNNGNLVVDQSGATLGYDAWNQLVQTTYPAPRTDVHHMPPPVAPPESAFQYDASGRRVEEYDGTTFFTYYYSSDWQVVEEHNPETGALIQQNVWSPAYVNAMVERDSDITGTQQRLYAAQDANWDTTALINTSGTVVERDQYDPYGAVTYLSSSFTPLSGNVSGYEWKYLFQGGRFDTPTGLYLFQYRDENPTLGVWEEQDPAGYPNGANRYEMEGDDPTTRVDPAGTDVVDTGFFGLTNIDGQTMFGNYLNQYPPEPTNYPLDPSSIPFHTVVAGNYQYFEEGSKSCPCDSDRLPVGETDVWIGNQVGTAFPLAPSAGGSPLSPSGTSVPETPFAGESVPQQIYSGSWKLLQKVLVYGCVKRPHGDPKAKTTFYSSPVPNMGGTYTTIWKY